MHVARVSKTWRAGNISLSIAHQAVTIVPKFEMFTCSLPHDASEHWIQAGRDASSVADEFHGYCFLSDFSNP